MPSREESNRREESSTPQEGSEKSKSIYYNTSTIPCSVPQWIDLEIRIGKQYYNSELDWIFQRNWQYRKQYRIDQTEMPLIAWHGDYWWDWRVYYYYYYKHRRIEATNTTSPTRIDSGRQEILWYGSLLQGQNTGGIRKAYQEAALPRNKTTPSYHYSWAQCSRRWLLVEQYKDSKEGTTKEETYQRGEDLD